MADQNSNGLVIHVSSLNDRSTEVVMRDVIRIGASEECDVKIRLPQTAATVNGPVIELARQDGVYRIANVDATLEVRLNGRPIKPNRGIYDGDEIWIGPSGPSIHFFPIEASAALVPGRRDAHVAPFIEQAAMEASATARRGRKIIADQQAQLAAQQEELKRANGLLGTLVTSNQAMLKTLSLGELLRADYGGGV